MSSLCANWAVGPREDVCESRLSGSVRGTRHDCQHDSEENCWGTAVAESFFATVEWELLADGDFSMRSMATRALVPFIEDWYNRERLHSAFGDVSNNAFGQDPTRRRRAAFNPCPLHWIRSRPHDHRTNPSGADSTATRLQLVCKTCEIVSGLDALMT